MGSAASHLCPNLMMFLYSLNTSLLVPAMFWLFKEVFWLFRPSWYTSSQPNLHPSLLFPLFALHVQDPEKGILFSKSSKNNSLCSPPHPSAVHILFWQTFCRTEKMSVKINFPGNKLLGQICCNCGHLLSAHGDFQGITASGKAAHNFDITFRQSKLYSIVTEPLLNWLIRTLSSGAGRDAHTFSRCL